MHAVGGTLGAFLTGFLATQPVNANLRHEPRRASSVNTLWLEQLKAIGLTLCLAVVGTMVIAYTVKAVMGLRAS